MKRNTKAALILLLSTLTMGSACQQSVVQPPTPTVQQTEVLAWAKAVTYFGAVEEARHTANTIALGLSQQTPPKIPVSVIESLEKINGIAQAGTRLLLASPTSFDQSIAAQVLTLANDILNELARIQPEITSSPELVEAVEDVEAAATEIKEGQ